MTKGARKELLLLLQKLVRCDKKMQLMIKYLSWEKNLEAQSQIHFDIHMFP